MDRSTTVSSTLAVLHGVAPHPSRSGDRANEAFASVVKNRKGWKSSKNGEAVWPVDLEAALVEGLEKYVPQNVRVARSLGRLPLRNRFISDFIYKKTGKRRTPKQVGSRIQQMRDTSAGKQLMELLRPYVAQRRLTDLSGSGISCNSLAAGCQDSEDDSNSSESSQCLEAEFINVIYIDLVPPLPSQTVRGMLTDSPVERINETGSSMHPRSIHSIDPTVAFLSRSTISAHAVYIVRRQDTVVHTECVPLEYAGHLSGESDDMNDKDNPHLYRSALVPRYWERICNSTTPTQFTIEQEVRLDLSTASERPLFSSLYKFRFIPNPSPSKDEQQTHLTHLTIHDKFAEPTAEDQHSSEVWDISAFLEPYLEVLSQDITIDDGTFLDEYFSSTIIQSPPSTIGSPESQSGDLFTPTPPSRPHSTILVSSCKSELSNNLSCMSSPILSPAVTTPSTLFGFSVVDHDSHAKEGTEMYFDTFHSSKHNIQ